MAKELIMRYKLDFTRPDAEQGILSEAFSNTLSKHFGDGFVFSGLEDGNTARIAFTGENGFYGVRGMLTANIINHTIGVPSGTITHKRFFVDIEVDVYQTYSMGRAFGICLILFPALLWFRFAKKNAAKAVYNKMGSVMAEVKESLAEGPQPE